MFAKYNYLLSVMIIKFLILSKQIQSLINKELLKIFLYDIS